jgi:hypothetical protein
MCVPTNNIETKAPLYGDLQQTALPVRPPHSRRGAFRCAHSAGAVRTAPEWGARRGARRRAAPSRAPTGRAHGRGCHERGRRRHAGRGCRPGRRRAAGGQGLGSPGCPSPAGGAHRPGAASRARPRNDLGLRGRRGPRRRQRRDPPPWSAGPDPAHRAPTPAPRAHPSAAAPLLPAEQKEHCDRHPPGLPHRGVPGQGEVREVPDACAARAVHLQELAAPGAAVRMRIKRMNGGGQPRRRPYHRSPLPSLSRGTAPRERIFAPISGAPPKLAPRSRGNTALRSSSGRLRTRRAGSCGSHSPGTASHLPRTPARGGGISATSRDTRSSAVGDRAAVPSSKSARPEPLHRVTNPLIRLHLQAVHGQRGSYRPCRAECARAAAALPDPPPPPRPRRKGSSRRRRRKAAGAPAPSPRCAAFSAPPSSGPLSPRSTLPQGRPGRGVSPRRRPLPPRPLAHGPVGPTALRRLSLSPRSAHFPGPQPRPPGAPGPPSGPAATPTGATDPAATASCSPAALGLGSRGSAPPAPPLGLSG